MAPHIFAGWMGKAIGGALFPWDRITYPTFPPETPQTLPFPLGSKTQR
jgi:hypothetical protein